MQIQFIQAVRGFAALSVVVFHAQILVPVAERGQQASVLSWLKMGDIGVDLFFIVSGFVMTMMLDADEENYQGVTPWLSKFLFRRFWRVMLPYWVFTLLAYVGLTLLAPGKAAGQATLLASFLLIPGSQPFALMVGWSLVYEVYFYLIFGFMCFWWGRSGAVSTAALCAIASIALPWFAGREYITGVYNGTLPLYFSVGIVLALYRYQINSFLAVASSWVIFFAALVSIVLIATFYPYAYEVHTQSAWRVVGYGPVAIILFSSFWILAKLLGRINWLGLGEVGEWSYSLYLSHWLVLNVLVLLLAKLGWYPGFWTILPAVGICLVVAYISWRVVEEPLMRYGKRVLA
jgi:exopolysaccharide production protein ExoZ